jgi:hypothetical protein
MEYSLIYGHPTVVDDFFSFQIKEHVGQTDAAQTSMYCLLVMFARVKHVRNTRTIVLARYLHTVTHVRIGKNTIAVHCTNLFGQKKSNRKREMKSNLERKKSYYYIYVYV